MQSVANSHKGVGKRLPQITFILPTPHELAVTNLNHFPSSFSDGGAGLNVVPSALNGVGVATGHPILVGLWVIPHLMRRAVTPLNLVNGGVGRELVTSDESARKNVTVNQVIQRGSIPIGDLDKEIMALRRSFNTAEHPHTLNTMTPVTFPFSKLGFINLHNNAWTANSIMMENHHLPNHLTHEQHPIGDSCRRRGEMRTAKAVSNTTKNQTNKMKHLVQWNSTTHKECPFCDGVTEATTMGMHAGTAPTTNETFFVRCVSKLVLHIAHGNEWECWSTLCSIRSPLPPLHRRRDAQLPHTEA